MKKIDILIIGSLSASSIMGGVGGDLIACESYENFDTHGSVVIRGDVSVDTFDFGGLTVAVCGTLAVRGGGDV